MAMFALSACQPSSGPYTNPKDAKQAVLGVCKKAFEYISKDEVIDGGLIVSYKSSDGSQFVYSWPEKNSGDVDAVCVVDIYKKRVKSLMVDENLRDGSEVRKDRSSELPKELRTF